MAGVTVGIIAIPLAMALAIASGVPPQYGLYTAFIAGFVIALTGGSRFSVSGPTAAFVVILYPIAQTYGLGGLLVASLMSGVLLIVMALMRLGRFIEYIPEAVTLGFTGGIAVVIATLQVKDFFGLNIEQMPEHYWDKLAAVGQALSGLDMMTMVVAIATLAVLLLWPRLKSPVPPHLPAVIIGSLLAMLLNANGAAIETIGSRFSYLLADGTVGAGIPPFLPEFAWPWNRPDASGEPLGISWTMVRDLLPAAFAIAMLGAIESLLCAVVLDGMTGKRHSANSELLGQGIGNVITPFFGGITATAAIARSAANYRAGAVSPVAAMAALLLMVAWNMSEAPKSVQLLKTAPRGDVLVFITCFSLTVLLDMVIAITTGVLLAAVLFMREMAEMTRVTDITGSQRMAGAGLPDGWRVFKINGPLFFAAADRIFGELAQLSASARGFILYMDGVTILDAGGLSALNKLISTCRADGTQVVIADLQYQPLRTLARAGIKPEEDVVRFYPALDEALKAESGLASLDGDRV
jgi:SulP family sulfate permease